MSFGLVRQMGQTCTMTENIHSRQLALFICKTSNRRSKETELQQYIANVTFMVYLIVICRTGSSVGRTWSRWSSVNWASTVIIRTWSRLKMWCCICRASITVIRACRLLKTRCTWGLWATDRTCPIHRRRKSYPIGRFSTLSTAIKKLEDVITYNLTGEVRRDV